MKWLRPSGTTIETNDRDETIEYCLKIGWTEYDAQKNNDSEQEAPKKQKKKGSKKKKG